MLNKKIAVSSFIFVLIAVGAWYMDNLMNVQRSKQLHPSTLQHYRIYSSYQSIHHLEPSSPYLPREYMRIIRLDTVD